MSKLDTVGAVFKSADSIVLKSFLLRVILQRGFYCSEDSIALSKILEVNLAILFIGCPAYHQVKAIKKSNWSITF